MTAPTLVRNTRPGPTVFTNPQTQESVEWGGAGDQNGADLQPISQSMLENVQFQRNVTRGILIIETDESLAERTFAQHKAEWDGRIQAQRTAGEQSMDETPNNDSVVKTCIGPSGKGPNLACGADVPIKMSKLAEVPPLCTFHQDLVPQFVASEGERLVDGKPEIIWKRAQMDARTSQD